MAKKKSLPEKIQKELNKLEALHEKEEAIISNMQDLVMEEEDLEYEDE